MNERATAATPPATSAMTPIYQKSPSHVPAALVHQPGRLHLPLEHGPEFLEVPRQPAPRFSESDRSLGLLALRTTISSARCSCAASGRPLPVRVTTKFRCPRDARLFLDRQLAAIRQREERAHRVFEAGPPVGHERAGERRRQRVGQGGAGSRRAGFARRGVVSLSHAEEQQEPGDEHGRRDDDPDRRRLPDRQLMLLPLRRRVDQAAARQADPGLRPSRSRGCPARGSSPPCPQRRPTTRRPGAPPATACRLARSGSAMSIVLEAMR